MLISWDFRIFGHDLNGWFVKYSQFPPPAMRPSVKHDAQQRSEDDLTHIIINIIKHNNKLKQILANQQESGEENENNKKIIDDWTSVLQYYIATMVDNKISGASPVTQRSGRALNRSVKDTREKPAVFVEILWESVLIIQHVVSSHQTQNYRFQNLAFQ